LAHALQQVVLLQPRAEKSRLGFSSRHCVQCLRVAQARQRGVCVLQACFEKSLFGCSWRQRTHFFWGMPLRQSHRFEAIAEASVERFES
jgi:hypothetical protein